MRRWLFYCWDHIGQIRYSDSDKPSTVRIVCHECGRYLYWRPAVDGDPTREQLDTIDSQIDHRLGLDTVRALR